MPTTEEPKAAINPEAEVEQIKNGTSEAAANVTDPVTDQKNP